MCWMSKNSPCMQIAEKDIPVFKILRKDLISPYLNFPYNIGEIYKIREINVRCEYGDHCIREGFHSYDLSSVYTIYLGFLVEVMYGYYRLDYFDVRLFRVVDCVIPEGSKYYKNEVGEIVSDCIKICKVRE